MEKDLMMVTGKFIRPYEDSDLEELLVAFRNNVPDFFDAEEENDFKHFILNERDKFFVVGQNDKVLGCCGYVIIEDENEAKISWIFFHPDVQGQGLGRWVVQYCLREIEKSGKANKVIVRTSQMVYQFFHQLGFTLEFTKDDYWAQGFHLYFMSRLIKNNN